MDAYLLAATVGFVFLGAGAIKALDARRFARDIDEYRLLPRRRIRLAALALIALECALGAALVVRLADVLVPVAAAIVIVLFGLTLWALVTHRVEDCGCYGGLLRLSLGQSLLLDAGYLALLATAWVGTGAARSAGFTPRLWKLLVVVAAGAAGVLTAQRSIQRGALIDFGLLKAGKRWNPRWLVGSPRRIEQGSHVVVFLSEDCPYCKQWVPLLNVIEVQADLPRVLGVLAGRSVDRDRFLTQHMIRFPVASIPRPLMGMMATAFPTAAIVENGVIRQTFVGQFPPDLHPRVRQFFDSIAISNAGATAAFSG
jgi:hypothetical protein